MDWTRRLMDDFAARGAFNQQNFVAALVRGLEDSGEEIVQQMTGDDYGRRVAMRIPSPKPNDEPMANDDCDTAGHVAGGDSRLRSDSQGSAVLGAGHDEMGDRRRDYEAAHTADLDAV